MPYAIDKEAAFKMSKWIAVKVVNWARTRSGDVQHVLRLSGGTDVPVRNVDWPLVRKALDLPDDGNSDTA